VIPDIPKLFIRNENAISRAAPTQNRYVCGLSTLAGYLEYSKYYGPRNVNTTTKHLTLKPNPPSFQIEQSRVLNPPDRKFPNLLLDPIFQSPCPRIGPHYVFGI